MSIGDNIIRFTNARLDLGSSQLNELAPCLPVPVLLRYAPLLSSVELFSPWSYRHGDLSPQIPRMVRARPLEGSSQTFGELNFSLFGIGRQEHFVLLQKVGS
jgi:hypothetical protein